MKKNDILYFQQIVEEDESEESIAEKIDAITTEVPAVYSYTVMVDRSKGICYKINYALSENDKYNTITKESIKDGILNTIRADRANNGKYIIGHKQPPIDLMIELYEPLVQRLSREQCNRWRFLEYEDVCQICRMTIVILYNAGYFIHKRLLCKAFNNAILREVRSIAPSVDYISIENRIDNGSEDLEKLRLSDTLRDTATEEAEMDAEEEKIRAQIYGEVKDILVDMMGERQYEQFYNDYAKGHTTTWSRRKMQTIKAAFEQRGLTIRDFNNKYGN